MPKNKIKKHFMVAVGDGAGFYRAETKNKAFEAAKQNGSDVYKMQGPLGAMKWHIQALTNYALLHQMLPQSDAMRHEYAAIVAETFLANPCQASALFCKVREFEKEVRLANLSMMTSDEYCNQYGDDYHDNVPLNDLRALPRGAYRMRSNTAYNIDIDDLTAFTLKLEEVQRVIVNHATDPERSRLLDAIAYKLSALEPEALIRVGDEMGIGYGDRDYDEDYDHFEGAPKYGDVYYDVRAAVMKYWDDLNVRDIARGGAQKTFAFAVGQRQKANQAVYVEGDFVRKNAEKLTL